MYIIFRGLVNRKNKMHSDASIFEITTTETGVK